MAPYFETADGGYAGEAIDDGFSHAQDTLDATEQHKRAEKWAEENGVTIFELQDFAGRPCKTLPNKYPTNEG